MLTLETADQIARGELRVVMFDHSYNYELRKGDWDIYRAAKRDGFLFSPRAQYRYRRLEKIWWCWCEARDWPVVIIKPRRTYALIECDQIALPKRVTDDDLEPLRPLFAEHCVGGWTSVDSSFICASRVPIATAPFVASRIVALLWNLLNLPKRSQE